MELKKPYKDIHETMKYIKLQIIDSVPFACMTVPQFRKPSELFYWLKNRTRYKNDPEGTELLQSMQTMFRNNWHGESGLGDCDCFTITAIASMIANQWHGLSIILVGREKSHPVHIYASIKWNGKTEIFDLTNPRYNFERKSYKYKQVLPVHWENW